MIVGRTFELIVMTLVVVVEDVQEFDEPLVGGVLLRVGVDVQCFARQTIARLLVQRAHHVDRVRIEGRVVRATDAFAQRLMFAVELHLVVVVGRVGMRPVVIALVVLGRQSSAAFLLGRVVLRGRVAVQ